MNPEQAKVTNYGRAKDRRNRASCLLWLLVAFLSLLVALGIVLLAAYAGWNTGVQAAQSNATGTADIELREQCDLLRQNLEDANLELARSRIEWLRRVVPAPDCLYMLAPTATAAYLNGQPRPTASPTQTTIPVTATTVPTVEVAVPATQAENEAERSYDLDALLAEALADLEARNYTAAIDTLEAIVSIDDSYERERVRGMLLEALSAQALALYRSFKLSEAIVLTERAEVYGDIGELNFERYVADTYLIGQRSKTTNPAEAVRRFGEIYYQHNPNYMNGQVVGELQDALRYYADALLLQGEACQALEQYAAALALQPRTSLVSRGALTTNQQEAAQACGALNGDAVGTSEIASVGTRLPIGERGGENSGQSG